MERERLHELDILRTLGTMIIVFHHLPDYAGNFYDLNYFGIPLNLGYLNVLNTYFGLSIFVFVSGFVLHHTTPKIGNIASFLRRRAVRIYPLYWVALILFILTLRWLSVWDTVIHVFGFQILLAPEYSLPMPTLWFVGLIVMLYLFYVVLARHTRDAWGMLALSIAVFLGFCLIRYVFDIVEYRFFLYYFIFSAGVLCRKTTFFSRYTFGVLHILLATFVLVGAVLVFRSFHEGPIYEQGGVTEAFISQAPLSSVLIVSVAVNMIMLSFLFIVFVLSRRLKKYLGEKVIQIVSLLSSSSYAVYLFHRPILDVMNQALSHFPFFHSYWRFFLLALVGLPLIFVFSYIVQALYKRITDRLNGVGRNL